MPKRQKKTPVRTCVGCRESRPKRDLIRVVRGEEGRVFVDPQGKANGRGAYVCGHADCLGSGLAKSLASALKMDISEGVAEDIRRQAAQLAEEMKTEE